MKTITYEFITEPVWTYEAAALLSNNFHNHISDIQQGHSDTAEGQAFINGPFKRFVHFWEEAVSQTRCFLTPELSDIYYALPYDNNSSFFTHIMKQLLQADPFQISEEQLKNAVYRFIESHIGTFCEQAQTGCIRLDSEDELRQTIADLKINEYNASKILFLYENYTDIWQNFLLYMKQAIPVLKNLFLIIQDDYTQYVHMIGTKQYLDNLLFESNRITSLPFDQATIFFAIFDFNYFCMVLSKAHAAFEVGYLFGTMRELHVAEQFQYGKLASALSVLGDELNLSILKLVKKESMNAYMVADKLKQPLRTILDHLALLREYEFVSISLVTEQCSEMLYCLNEVMLKKISEKIMDF
ncbi:MAG: helix-turn-helix transcriptional regulator [Lachnospiraceae bacterium]|nr:helix-turn-helix transcriptional regulator [Lachnospiraceae bacterium]